MDFINLHQVAVNLANWDADNGSAYLNGLLHDAGKASAAAAAFHQALWNAQSGRPQWASIHPMTHMPVFDDAASGDGMAILERLAAWRWQVNKIEVDYAIECRRNNTELSFQELQLRLSGWPYEDGGMRAHKIGFDRLQLVNFLSANGISHSIRLPFVQTLQPTDPDVRWIIERAKNGSLSQPTTQDVAAQSIESDVDAGVHSPTQRIAPATRIKPQGGDALTPLIWEICYDLQDAGQEIKPRHVMVELRKRAQNKVWPLVDAMSGGVRFELEKGKRALLDSEALRKRIDKWKEAITGG